MLSQKHFIVSDPSGRFCTAHQRRNTPDPDFAWMVRLIFGLSHNLTASAVLSMAEFLSRQARGSVRSLPDTTIFQGPGKHKTQTSSNIRTTTPRTVNATDPRFCCRTAHYVLPRIAYELSNWPPTHAAYEPYR